VLIRILKLTKWRVELSLPGEAGIELRKKGIVSDKKLWFGPRRTRRTHSHSAKRLFFTLKHKSSAPPLFPFSLFPLLFALDLVSLFLLSLRPTPLPGITPPDLIMFTLGLAALLALAAAPFALAMNVSNVLIYSYTAGYRHDSIPTAISQMTQRGPDYGINFLNTEDMTMFTDTYLSQFDVIFFLSNTDEGGSCAARRRAAWRQPTTSV